MLVVFVNGVKSCFLQELGNSSGSHFSSSSPMTIDVQLGDIGHGLLGSSHLSTINQSVLAMGLGGENIRHHSETHEQPLSATPSPAGSLQDEDMDDFKVSTTVPALVCVCECILDSMLDPAANISSTLSSPFLSLFRGVCW